MQVFDQSPVSGSTGSLGRGKINTILHVQLSNTADTAVDLDDPGTPAPATANPGFHDALDMPRPDTMEDYLTSVFIFAQLWLKPELSSNIQELRHNFCCRRFYFRPFSIIIMLARNAKLIHTGLEYRCKAPGGMKYAWHLQNYPRKLCNMTQTVLKSASSTRKNRSNSSLYVMGCDWMCTSH